MLFLHQSLLLGQFQVALVYLAPQLVFYALALAQLLTHVLQVLPHALAVVQGVSVILQDVGVEVLASVRHVSPPGAACGGRVLAVRGLVAFNLFPDVEPSVVAVEFPQLLVDGVLIVHFLYSAVDIIGIYLEPGGVKVTIDLLTLLLVPFIFFYLFLKNPLVH